ncbi:phospholipase A [Oligoflexus tunisiensis]|uniref:phospholipase A n=1 Tax=Oligoflexus tunisiensis TaxID=708132 RepID=UPI00159F0F12|nr:phospholipase A [Oligoflexus tunisiensis]
MFQKNIARSRLAPLLLLLSLPTHAKESDPPPGAASEPLEDVELPAETPTSGAAVMAQAPTLLRNIDRAEEQNIFRHRDIYAIGGKPNTKIQLSFKLRPILSLPAYFAYNQQMFWEVTKDSRPFEDIDFNPEFYYVLDLDQPMIRGLSLGVEHRSNGKADAESRSLDRVFAEVDARIGRGAWRMHGTVRLYWLYDIDWQNNPNIRRYTGLLSTRISFEGITAELFPSKGEMYLSFLPGGVADVKKGMGAVEFTVKYRFGLSDVMPYVMFQYYYGYMESLIEYNELQKSYRLGLAF